MLLSETWLRSSSGSCRAHPDVWFLDAGGGATAQFRQETVITWLEHTPKASEDVKELF